MDLFMELQVIGDRAVKKLAFSHIVHSIRRMNQKSKNEVRNRKLQPFSNLYRFATSCLLINQYYLAHWRPPLYLSFV
jgi:hypothetical protein